MTSKEQELHDHEHIKDLIECRICNNKFEDPRMLPCVHSFCLKCLEDDGSKSRKEPDDLMACPVCFKEFMIPSDGFQGLQKNYFLEKLMMVSDNLKSSKECTLCDPCMEDSKPDSGQMVPPAEVYCNDCRQNFCKECYRQHGKFKGTNFHEVVAAGEHIKSEAGLKSAAFQQTSCVHHGKVQLQIFCSDCKKVVCALCFVETHQTHKGADIVKAADDNRKQMSGIANKLQNNLNEVDEICEKLEEDKLQQSQTLETLKQEVTRQFEDLKNFGEEHMKILLSEVENQRLAKLTEFEKMKDKLDKHAVSLKNHMENVNIIMETATAADICQDMHIFMEKTDEVQNLHENVMKTSSVPPYKACLVKTSFEDILTPGGKNILGIIQNAADNAGITAAANEYRLRNLAPCFDP